MSPGRGKIPADSNSCDSRWLIGLSTLGSRWIESGVAKSVVGSGALRRCQVTHCTATETGMALTRPAWHNVAVFRIRPHK